MNKVAQQGGGVLADNVLPIMTGRGGAELTIVVPTLNERANISLLVDRLRQSLPLLEWEVVFVDDDSKDGTMLAVRDIAASDHRVRGIRRIARRGLAGACLEGILSSSAPIVAVMDGDLQHDETCLSTMFAVLQRGEADLVIASRYQDNGGADGGFTKLRSNASRLATHLARVLLRTQIDDPMSGFFMLRREIVEAVAPRLSRQGFKILLDIVASSPTTIRIREIPYVFAPRLHGQSKLDSLVALEYAGLLVSKMSGDLISTRFLAFGLVGSAGVVVHLSVLHALLPHGLSFAVAQTAAMFAAMAFNYTLNNAFTYRDQRRRGWRFLTGLLMFAALCSFGVVAGVGVSTLLYSGHSRWWVAGLAGAIVGSAWNYITNSAITWRRQ
ncbi:glycosyltransferase family 2 protein [Mesorhizobium erdmanii]|uniref:Glycosyltransferase family 2 protein n=1 Tax=Mesorhizobium erdmanii TaxID=1777866 RepID=A0A6M7UFG0_9HYPH|nr:MULTISPECIES: glycosyltransferase family 2 protein [Mesorhizobium]QKC74890.1 glycosyltransferase family 2 protein [Mesorhizobium erdmanii]